MEKNLKVSYISQWDKGADASNNDCGPASLAMMVNYYEGKEYVIPDDITKALGSNGLISFNQLFDVITNLKYKYRFSKNGTLEALKDEIDAGNPVLVLVHYGSLQSTQDKKFKNGHFMVVVGYRPDDSLYCNDPNFRDQYRNDGNHHVYTKTEFMKAWEDCYLDKNLPFQMVVLDAKVPVDVTEKPVNEVKAVVTLRVRTSPTINAKNIVVDRTIPVGTKFKVDKCVIGDEVQGNKLWWKLKDESLFAWTGGTNYLPTGPTSDPVVDNPPDNSLIELTKKLDEVTKQRDEALDILSQIVLLATKFANSNNTVDNYTAGDKESVLEWITRVFKLKK